MDAKTRKSELTRAAIIDAALELARTGGRYGLATMCVGVGQGTAVLIERV